MATSGDPADEGDSGVEGSVFHLPDIDTGDFTGLRIQPPLDLCYFSFLTLLLIMGENTKSLSVLMLAVDFFVDILYNLRKIPFITSFRKNFIRNRCWILSDILSFFFFLNLLR